MKEMIGNLSLWRRSSIRLCFFENMSIVEYNLYSWSHLCSINWFYQIFLYWVDVYLHLIAKYWGVLHFRMKNWKMDCQRIEYLFVSVYAIYYNYFSLHDSIFIHVTRKSFCFHITHGFDLSSNILLYMEMCKHLNV